MVLFGAAGAAIAWMTGGAPAFVAALLWMAAGVCVLLAAMLAGACRRRHTRRALRPGAHTGPADPWAPQP